MELLDKLQIQDLNDEHKELADIVGIEAFKKLVERYSGSDVYIPQKDTVTVNLRNRMIREEYDGYNSKHLAYKWGLTHRYVQSIVSSVRKEVKSRPCKNQISFF